MAAITLLGLIITGAADIHWADPVAAIVVAFGAFAIGVDSLVLSNAKAEPSS